jgi:hypothetical protein
MSPYGGHCHERIYCLKEAAELTLAGLHSNEMAVRMKTDLPFFECNLFHMKETFLARLREVHFDIKLTAVHYAHLSAFDIQFNGRHADITGGAQHYRQAHNYTSFERSARSKPQS